jgi:hypothetical protein
MTEWANGGVGEKAEGRKRAEDAVLSKQGGVDMRCRGRCLEHENIWRLRFICHSSFIVHRSSFILHPSSFILQE